MKDLLQNYDRIILEISSDKNTRDLQIDRWDVIAAVFMAAFVTVAALGAAWIAYYIIIYLSLGLLGSSGTIISVGVTCIEWLKVKENRSKATKYLKDFLNGNFAAEMAEMSVESVKVIHGKIKRKLIELFDGNIENFERVIMQDHIQKN